MTTPTLNALLTAIEILSVSGELKTSNGSDLRQVIAWLEDYAKAKAEDEALKQYAKKHGVPVATVRKAWRAHNRKG